MQAKKHPGGHPSNSPPTDPTQAQPPHQCEVCGVRFAKAGKRDVHLLDVHRAHFGLSPRAQSPSTTGGVDLTVSRAVSEANLIFSRSSSANLTSVACSLCANSTTKFKNARGLAQHILSKHSDETLISETSVVSHKMAPPPAKRAKVATGGINKATVAAGKSTKTKQKQKAKAKAKRKTPPAPAPSAMKPPLSPKSLSSRGGSSSPRASSPAAKMITAQRPVSADKSCSQANIGRDQRSIPMDFSAIIGFTSNAHKSYYRLAKR